MNGTGFGEDWKSRLVGQFDLHTPNDTIGGMIAVANPFAGYMTIRKVMDEIGARAPSTVLRMVYDEDKPRPEGKRLAGTLIPGHGWMISRKSVEKFLAEEQAKPKGVGFPRGHSRQKADVATKPPAKRAAKSAKAAKKPARG